MGVRTKKYVYDDDVFEPGLLQKLREALEGRSEQITFLSGGPLSRPESLLGEKLAWECRLALNTPTKGSVWVLTRGARKANISTGDIVHKLTSMGFPVRVIMHALDMHEYSIRRWKPGPCERVLHPVSKTYMAAGYARLRKRLELPDGCPALDIALALSGQEALDADKIQGAVGKTRVLANEIGAAMACAREIKATYRPDYVAGGHTEEAA